MSSIRLTETSYIVLGLLEQAEPATPYDLKQLAQVSTVNFWSVPHTQLYSECARLAQAGLLSEQREQSGRRRRIYRLSELGRERLESWRDEPTDELYEVRDVGTLKLFFGGDPVKLADAQLQAHTDRLAAYEEMLQDTSDGPRGWRVALEAGIGHEREFLRFWRKISGN
ncbi:MAG TPA: PadR family transcriptional regulator [Solirubrobacteraceae bacterium]